MWRIVVKLPLRRNCHFETRREENRSKARLSLTSHRLRYSRVCEAIARYCAGVLWFRASAPSACFDAKHCGLVAHQQQSSHAGNKVKAATLPCHVALLFMSEEDKRDIGTNLDGWNCVASQHSRDESAHRLRHACHVKLHFTRYHEPPVSLPFQQEDVSRRFGVVCVVLGLLEYWEMGPRQMPSVVDMLSAV